MSAKAVLSYSDMLPLLYDCRVLRVNAVQFSAWMSRNGERTDGAETDAVGFSRCKSIIIIIIIIIYYAIRQPRYTTHYSGKQYTNNKGKKQ